MPAYRARYVIPVAQPPVRDGVVIVEQGRIGDVRQTAGKGQKVVDLGDVALLPGWINAHTHLEFSRLFQPIGTLGQALPDWIRQVVSWRRAHVDDESSAAPWLVTARAAGLAESLASGVTTLCDIVSGEWSWARYDRPMRVLAMAELLATERERAQTQWNALQQFLGTMSSGGAAWGISPHSPATVRWEMIEAACRYSAVKRVPVAMHLAESREELQLLQSGSGPWRTLLEELDAWQPDLWKRSRTMDDYLEILATAHRAIIVHGNYLAPGNLRQLAGHRDRMGVVFCPRTHAFFQHDPYPLEALLRANVPVAIGTDSRASNPDLNFLNELRWLVENSSLTPPEIIRMATAGGAEVLGRAGEIGILQPGTIADMIAVGLPQGAEGDPYGFLGDQQSHVSQVFVGGQPVFTAGSC